MGVTSAIRQAPPLVSPCLCERQVHLKCLAESFMKPAESSTPKARAGRGADGLPSHISSGAGRDQSGSNSGSPRVSRDPRSKVRELARSSPRASCSPSRGKPADGKLTDEQLENLVCACPKCNSVYVGEAPIVLLNKKLAECKERNLPWAEAKASSELADVLRKQRDFEGAIALYQAALDTHDKDDDEDGQNVASGQGVYTNHFNLGVCYKNLGHRRFKEAEFHFKRALQLRERELGPGHTDVATDRHQLAMLVHSMQRPEEALVLAQEALKVRQAKLGTDHAATQLTQQLVSKLNNELKGSQGSLQIM
eukprot:CAMPEP_0118945980 /NCGR_PEP_ID=MMETSP1169-20130426/43372_1 /TAXON_ID=36882 /ORGANISM="Pyramimonas obovata, Strain CCMP722" /LENGTH=308 /DNA_ID=CAMNT_0006891841 /DNA_START=130 /DNA_END=1055 /DNA_ORIENTATION=+